MYAIVGSGFGLYGYLPAIAGSLKCPVILPETVKLRFEARPELAIFEPFIRWAPTIYSALQQANIAVIAVPPRDQPGIVAECLEHKAIDAIVLEKPVAATPDCAEKVINSIMGSGLNCRVGYTFVHSAFAEDLLAADSTSPHDELTIEWLFTAYHFANDIHTWKRRHSQGGGALRFYGIHLIALLALLGYGEVIHSTLAGANSDEPERWLATLIGPGFQRASVILDSRSPVMSFRITRKANGKLDTITDVTDPFTPISQTSGTDRRAGYLSKLLRTLDEPDFYHHARVKDTQRLWERIERATQIGDA